MIDPIAMTSLAELSGNVGFGLVTIGAGLGIGLIGSKAAEATGRNPGASSPIMVIAITLAALIDGVALISIFVKFNGSSVHGGGFSAAGRRARPLPVRKISGMFKPLILC